jgi:hypothetical protein
MRINASRIKALGLVSLAVFGACGGGGADKGANGSGDGADGGATSSGGASASGSGGRSAASGAASSSSDASASTYGPLGDAASFPTPGNPSGSCTAFALPAAAALVDTSKPTSVVGTGTAESCTFAALNSAVTKGGIITFDCGPAAVTIPVTATLTPPTSNAYAKDPSLQIVIDGGGKVTLDGQGAVRILSWVHTGSWRVNQDTLTLQRIRLIRGKTTPTQKIAACPASGSISNTQCSTGYDDGQGGALNMQDGNLRVIDSVFEDNEAAQLGPDTGGGAIYIQATGSPSFIVGSSFLGNTASNGGGVGLLWAGAFVLNSLFEGNKAVGTGANNNNASDCTCDNGDNKNQIGSGGNGGALYKDGGDGVALAVCGTEINGNSANEFGPAVFLTADGSGAQLILDDSTLTGNTTPVSYWQWCTGVSTDNPHASGSSTGSPSPIDTTFCNASGGSCVMTCSS